MKTGRELLFIGFFLFLSGCAGLSKQEVAAINSLSYEQKQQLYFEMLKAQYATPQPVYPIVYPTYYQPYVPRNRTVCYPNGHGGVSCTN